MKPITTAADVNPGDTVAYRKYSNFGAGPPAVVCTVVKVNKTSLTVTPIDGGQTFRAPYTHAVKKEATMSKPTLTEIVDQFQRDVIAAVIDHITELLAPLGPRAAVPPAPAVPETPTIDEVRALERGLAHAAARPLKMPATKHTRAPGEKRSKEVIAALTERLDAYVKAHPGQRIEQINAGLGTKTADLTLPMTRLIKARRVSVKGVRRATRYYPVRK